MNPDKNERRLFEGASGCDVNYAYQQMRETKKRYSKTDGVQGYHIIQSFAPNEVTPDQAFEVSREFVRRYLADKYEVIWSTHLDKNHYHNHIVFNSVSYMDGRKYLSNAKSYYEGIRKCSDEICQEYGLSIISQNLNDKSLTYFEWLSAKKGVASWQSIIKSDIDHAISQSLIYGAFLVAMENMGYELKQGKYIAFRPYGKERFSRGYKLGDEYSEQAIKDRIDGNEFEDMVVVRPRQNFVPYPKRYMPTIEKRYWAWMFRLGLVQKHQSRPKPSKYLKEELLKFERYKEQFKFLKAHSLGTENEFFSYVKSVDETIDKLNGNLAEFKAVLKKNKKLYDAIFALNNFEVASDMYAKGYDMMQKEHDEYRKAKKYLSDHGFKTEEEINSIDAEKTNVYDQISEIKKDINHYKSEKSVCNNIQISMEQIEKKEKMIEERKQEKQERSKNGRTIW